MEISTELLEKLSTADHVAILTGAGVSAESGIKTFRDPDGLWSKMNPAELASVEGFLSNPERIWEFYRHRKDVVLNTKPNAGHYAIAEMEKIFPKLTLITQNIDRLHHRAGSTKVLELHGNVEDNHCQDCKMPFHGETNLPDGELPKCKVCGGLVRPSVVWFGEMLPEETLREADRAAISCDVFFSIGTSAEVYPAANLPRQAKLFGAYLVEVNPNITSLSREADARLIDRSAAAMPLLLDEFRKFKENN